MISTGAIRKKAVSSQYQIFGIPDTSPRCPRATRDRAGRTGPVERLELTSGRAGSPGRSGSCAGRRGGNFIAGPSVPPRSAAPPGPRRQARPRGPRSPHLRRLETRLCRGPPPVRRRRPRGTGRGPRCRPRGGLTSKVHLACDALGRPLAFTVTSGNTDDCTQFTAVMVRPDPQQAGAPGGICPGQAPFSTPGRSQASSVSTAPAGSSSAGGTAPASPCDESCRGCRSISPTRDQPHSRRSS